MIHFKLDKILKSIYNDFIMNETNSYQSDAALSVPTRLLTVNLPVELHTKLKARCALQQQSMSEVVVKLIDMYLNFSNAVSEKDK